MDRADIVHENFLQRIASGTLPRRRTERTLNATGLTKTRLAEIFHAQILSRQLDRTARKLQARGQGYYTIGSSGHEGMAAIAAAFRPTDMAFLHYRDAAFQIQRAQQIPGQTPLWDILLGFVSAREDPISGGRHKVLGAKSLSIPPQTSTIASHLPKSVGAAYSLALARRIRPEHQAMADDGVVLCSFGDASFNHSTAQGALNTAGWTAYQGAKLPLVFICEDNGIGISTRTPAGWIEMSVQARPAIRYVSCDGLDMLDCYAVASATEAWVRYHGKPVFLHMRCVRLYGHAGADAQTAYLSKPEIEADEANDPLLHGARLMMEEAGWSDAELLDTYNEIGARVERVAEQAVTRPKLRNAAEVMASLIPLPRHCQPTNGPSFSQRSETFGTVDMRAMQQQQHMAKLINMTLTDLMLEHREIVLAGEDIGPKGGVYGVTQRLHHRFGAARVINTLLDEQSILGLAIGLAQNGLLPIPEIQFLAYLHNAEDQLRGEAATLSFFSNQQYGNPMLIRIAGLGYQRGFGGHFHNDNSIAVLRDIPGIIVACPSSGYDAALMLRECVRQSREMQRVVVFLEPIALYMTRDLHQAKDNQWSHRYPEPGSAEPIRLGEIGCHGEGTDLAIVTYGNGYYLSRQAEDELHREYGIACRVIDLRWLAPLPEDELLAAIQPCQNILIVDECRRSGSPSEALISLFSERGGHTARVARITAEDSFIATGPAYAATLPSRASILSAALALTGQSEKRRAR